MYNPDSYAINGYAYNQTKSALEFVKQFGAIGFRFFEVILYPGHLWPFDLSAPERRELRKFLQLNDLHILSLGVPALDPNITSALPEVRAFSIEIVHSALQLASEIAVPGIILSPGKTNPLQPSTKQQLLGWFYAALDELVPAADKLGTQLLIENLPAAFLPTAAGIMNALDTYGDDRIGVVYDTANATFFGEDLVDGVDRVKSRLCRLHLSDTTKSKFEHAAVGDGQIDFSSLQAAVARANYDWPPVLELITLDPDNDIARSLEALSAMGWEQPHEHLNRRLNT